MPAAKFILRLLNILGLPAVKLVEGWLMLVPRGLLLEIVKVWGRMAELRVLVAKYVMELLTGKAE